MPQVAAESEAIASNGSVFDVVHEFKRLNSTTWKLISIDFTDTSTINVDLVSFILCSFIPSNGPIYKQQQIM